MADPIDISAKLHAGIPTWPGSAGLTLARTRSFDRGDQVNVTQLEMDVHCGTHVEAPLHFVRDGRPLESIPLSTLVGEAFVAALPRVREIGPGELDACGIPAQCRRLLLRSVNSEQSLMQKPEFMDDFAALTVDGARWVAERGIRLIGADYLSIQLYGGDDETHRALMDGDVAILEGLVLDHVEPGPYRLTCLPLRLLGTEAAPARAILEPLG